VLYFGIAVVLLIGIYSLRPFDALHVMDRGMSGQRPPPDEMFDRGDRFPGPDRGPGPRGGRGKPAVDIVSIVLFITTWSTGMAITLMHEWRKTQQKAARAEADKAQAELSFLKAQINPHFLFNTLNNIYSLAVTKNEHTAKAIMKLSNIMRYVTDDVTQTEVPLQSEVNCIADYIDLQKLRLGEGAEVNFMTEGNFENKYIGPLLLMTFVENVFKYGISAHEPSPITVEISADDKSITLYCRNKIFPQRTSTERKGIGIENTKQRLKHLYPEKYDLKIEQDEGYYKVTLTISEKRVGSSKWD
jgi:LytS/YehU family sensor histidine kinase